MICRSRAFSIETWSTCKTWERFCTCAIYRRGNKAKTTLEEFLQLALAYTCASCMIIYLQIPQASFFPSFLLWEDTCAFTCAAENSTQDNGWEVCSASECSHSSSSRFSLIRAFGSTASCVKHEHAQMIAQAKECVITCPLHVCNPAKCLSITRALWFWAVSGMYGNLLGCNRYTHYHDESAWKLREHLWGAAGTVALHLLWESSTSASDRNMQHINVRASGLGLGTAHVMSALDHWAKPSQVACAMTRVQDTKSNMQQEIVVVTAASMHCWGYQQHVAVVVILCATACLICTYLPQCGKTNPSSSLACRWACKRR